MNGQAFLLIQLFAFTLTFVKKLTRKGQKKSSNHPTARVCGLLHVVYDTIWKKL